MNAFCCTPLSPSLCTYACVDCWAAASFLPWLLCSWGVYEEATHAVPARAISASACILLQWCRQIGPAMASLVHGPPAMLSTLPMPQAVMTGINMDSVACTPLQHACK